MRYDIAIVGGGIVGTATAMALAAGRRLSLVVLEAEPRLAAHQTGNNSGVIHSGLYYAPGSLKARTCVSGREALYRFCADHGIRHERCGKLVVATTEAERPNLEELHRRGTANGLKGLRMLDGDALREIEPHAAGVAGLHVPETGIVDFTAVAQAFADRARAAGAEIRLGSRVTGCERRGGAYTLLTASGEITCRFLINTAGLESDRVARLCGAVPDVRIIPFRGEYYELVPERRHLVKHLIYPVPDPRFPFLGVHFTRIIDGGVEAGPNAVLALKRAGYHRLSFSLRDTFATVLYPGFWRMALAYGKTGLGELYRSFSKRAFVAALRRLVPELASEDVKRAGAGVRAQAVDRAGRLLDDFCIVPGDRMLHVLNAPSPAATASIAIGRQIAEAAAKQFALG
jgi:L-2-hydroxyglutarate oxidase